MSHTQWPQLDECEWMIPRPKYTRVHTVDMHDQQMRKQGTGKSAPQRGPVPAAAPQRGRLRLASTTEREGTWAHGGRGARCPVGAVTGRGRPASPVPGHGTMRGTSPGVFFPKPPGHRPSGHFLWPPDWARKLTVHKEAEKPVPPRGQADSGWTRCGLLGGIWEQEKGTREHQRRLNKVLRSVNSKVPMLVS